MEYGPGPGVEESERPEEEIRRILAVAPEARDALYPGLGAAPLVQDAAYAIVPLAVGQGPAVGAVVVGFPTPTPFNEDVRSFLEALGSQCAIALERARLYEEAERGQRR